jgi:hypothetical protein
MKKVNHIDTTEAAFARYLKWKGVDTPLDSMRTFLGKSSAAEDDVTFLSGFQRPLNWHFYNNNGSIDNSWLPGRRTSEERVQKLNSKLDKYIKRLAEGYDQDDFEDLLETTGRIIHHIQDNSTPTHVVPIYHGPGLVDLYEVYGEVYAWQIKIVDSPDKIDPENGGRLLISITADEIADVVRSLDIITTDPPLLDLYETSAQESLKYIRQNSCEFYRNGRLETIPLDSFWKEHESEALPCPEKEKMKSFSKGFGSFGILCNNFGNHCFKVGDDLYEAANDDYLNIYKYFFKKSVLDSIVVLEYIYRKTALLENQDFKTALPQWH